jgi:D-serine deaminase-like pyridoxal phosphate-dependent protein
VAAAASPTFTHKAGLCDGGMDFSSRGLYADYALLPEMTEIQAGSYPLMDAAYRRIIGSDFAPSMTVLTTVISASHPDRVTVDAGYKAFATDRPFGPEAVDLSGVRWQWGGDEHGILFLENPSRTIRMGDHIEFVPPHCDPTVNLYDRIYAVHGELVEEVWPLKNIVL